MNATATAAIDRGQCMHVLANVMNGERAFCYSALCLSIDAKAVCHTTIEVCWFSPQMGQPAKIMMGTLQFGRGRHRLKQRAIPTARPPTPPGGRRRDLRRRALIRRGLKFRAYRKCETNIS